MALHFAIIRDNDADPTNGFEVLIAHDMEEVLVQAAYDAARFGSRKRSAAKIRAAYHKAKDDIHLATISLP